MPNFCSILTLQQRHKLVFGYTKESAIRNIPPDLCDMCLRYYNDIIDWKIEGNELSKFYECKYGEKINGPMFTIKDIPFKLELYPNGDYLRNKNMISLYLLYDEKLIPENIKKFMLYIVFFCRERKYESRTLEILKERWTRIPWYWWVLPFEYAQKANFTELNIGCYIQLLHIEYNDDTPNYSMRNIKMKIKDNFEWKLNEEELNRFQTAEFDQFLYSPNFNYDCFCITCSPNGDRFINDSNESVFTIVKVVRLPYGVKSIRIKYTMKMLSDKMTFEWDFETDCTLECGGKLNTEVKIKRSTFEQAKWISFEVKMDVIDVYIGNGVRLEREQYLSYGIL
eukprot:266940_1